MKVKYVFARLHAGLVSANFGDVYWANTSNVELFGIIATMMSHQSHRYESFLSECYTWVQFIFGWVNFRESIPLQRICWLPLTLRFLTLSQFSLIQNFSSPNHGWEFDTQCLHIKLAWYLNVKETLLLCFFNNCSRFPLFVTANRSWSVLTSFFTLRTAICRNSFRFLRTFRKLRLFSSLGTNFSRISLFEKIFLTSGNAIC